MTLEKEVGGDIPTDKNLEFLKSELYNGNELANTTLDNNTSNNSATMINSEIIGDDIKSCSIQVLDVPPVNGALELAKALWRKRNNERAKNVKNGDAKSRYH